MREELLLPTSIPLFTAESVFRNVVERINDAVQRSQAAESTPKWKFYLCLRWANDDMSVGAITADLLQIFSEVYNFPTESFSIQPNPCNRHDFKNRRVYQEDTRN